MPKRKPRFEPRVPLCPKCGKLLATVIEPNVQRELTNGWWCEDCQEEFNSRLGPFPKWARIQIAK